MFLPGRTFGLGELEIKVRVVVVVAGGVLSVGYGEKASSRPFLVRPPVR